MDESPGIERVWVGGEKLHHLRVETEVLAKRWELLPEAGGRRKEKRKERVKKLNEKQRQRERKSGPDMQICICFCKVFSCM